jgi:hypothetical protein
MLTELDHHIRELLTGGVLLAIAVLQGLTRYLRIRFGGAEWEPNFANVWRPLAQELHDGASLYMEGMGDNKPPLFELLNFLLSGLPNHGLVFLIITGVANGAVALLLWQLVSDEHENWAGLTTAGVWLFIISIVNGTHINVRSFALVGILGSLYVGSDQPVMRGSAIAMAGLFSQYAILFIPALAWDSIRRLQPKQRVRWLTTFAGSGILVLIGAFGIVGAIWGSRAALAGLYWSYGLPTGVTTTGFATAPDSYLSDPWMLTNTIQWGGWILHTGGMLSPLLLGASIRGWRRVKKRQWSVYLAGSLILLLPLVVRSYDAYWLMSLPFVSVLAVIEIIYQLEGN